MNSFIDIIENVFLEKAIRIKKLFLYNKEDALAVIGRSKQQKVLILRIDSFIIRGDYIQLFLEYSSNSFNLDKKNDVLKVASNFITNTIKKNNELVSLVLFDLFTKVVIYRIMWLK